MMKKKYVKFQGKTWENTFRIDHIKRMILKNWNDPSKGTVADADMVHNCSESEIEAIESILQDKNLIKDKKDKT